MLVNQVNNNIYIHTYKKKKYTLKFLQKNCIKIHIYIYIYIKKNINFIKNCNIFKKYNKKIN